MNGCLTGLVSITAGCATVEPWAAVIIGIIAGWMYIAGSKALLYFRIDDAVDAVPVHCVGGAWGMIATGLFSNEKRMDAAFNTIENIGWFYEWGRGSGNFSLLGAQLLSILFITGWTSVTMGSLFYILKVVGWLRMDELEERVGMDISRHKGAAYEINTPDEDHINELNVSRNRSVKTDELAGN